MTSRAGTFVLILICAVGCSSGDDGTTPTTLSIAETIELVEAQTGDIGLDVAEYETLFAGICADPGDAEAGSPASIVIPARCPDAVDP